MFVETESDNSDNNGEEEEPVIKRIYKLTKKAPKLPGITDTCLWDVETGPEDSEDSDTEDTLGVMGFPIDKSLEVGKNEEGLVFEKGLTKAKKCHMLQHLILCT